MRILANLSRRNFLAVSAAAGVAGAAGGAAARGPAPAESSATGQKTRPFPLSLASYSLRKFSLEQTLAMTRRVGLEAICLKSFHLPLTATDAEIAAARRKIEAAGIKLCGGGVIHMRQSGQIEPAFAYAKSAGMPLIVAAPAAELLDEIEKQAIENDIVIAIHNHGPGDDHFPTPAAAYEKIKNRDTRIGICHDIGHTARFGEDAIEQTKSCADRIYDVHIKDVTAATAQAHETVVGRGIISVPALLRVLAATNYGGYLSFEYEPDADDPLPGLAESVGYVRGVLDGMKREVREPGEPARG